jgi:hypothetical protein
VSHRNGLFEIHVVVDINVSPVYKKGLKSAAENYRPISLTFVCCKILEHIIARNIMQHAEKKTTFYIHYNMDFEKAVPVRHSSLNVLVLVLSPGVHQSQHLLLPTKLHLALLFVVYLLTSFGSILLFSHQLVRR